GAAGWSRREPPPQARRAERRAAVGPVGPPELDPGVSVVRGEVGEAAEGGKAGGIRATGTGVDLPHHERPGARTVRSPELLSVDSVVRRKEELREATIQETKATAAATTSATSAASTASGEI